MASDGTTPEALAASLLDGALHLKKGENVLIETWSHCLSYATACVVEARRRGARPLLLLEDEASYWASLDGVAVVGPWSRPGAHEWAALARTNAYVFFPGPADRPRYRALPVAVRSELTTFNPEWHRRARVARIRGVRSALGYASDAQAAHWGISAAEWRRTLIRSTVDVDLRTLSRAGRSVASKLTKGKELRITATNGTDLTVRLRGRTPIVDDGVVTPDDLAVGRNMTVSPPGTVVVALDEKSAEGVAIANRASYLPYGRTEGGEWEIAGGRLVQSRYTEGEQAFDRAFQAAPKGKDVVSLASVGLNPVLGPGVPQVEDQEVGAVTLGIGANHAFGGTNRTPFMSWIVIGDATVAVDGKPLCDRGHLF